MQPRHFLACPACGCAGDKAGNRIIYECESYRTDGNDWLAYKSDLCSARETIKKARNLCTTDHESKEAFIERMKAVLGVVLLALILAGCATTTPKTITIPVSPVEYVK